MLACALAALVGCVDAPETDRVDDAMKIYFPTWRGWEPLYGEVHSDPAITASGSRLDVFATAWGKVYHRTWDGSQWSPGNGNWEALGNNGHDVGAPVAVTIGSRVELFATENGTGHVIHREYSTAWTPWEDLGGSAADKPAVAVEHVYQAGGGPFGTIDEYVMNVFTRNLDGTLALRTGLASGLFKPWRNLGGGVRSVPTAVSWGDNRVDVFVRGTDDHLYHQYTDVGHDWTPGSYEYLGGSVATTPSVVSSGANRLDLVVTSTDASINHLAWKGSAWSSWENVASGSALHDAVWGYAPPVALAHGGRVEVLVVGGDRSLWHTTLIGSAWASWAPIADCAETPIALGAASPIAAPAMASADGFRWDIVFTGGDRGVWHGVTDYQDNNDPTGYLRPPACPVTKSVRWAIVMCQYADDLSIPMQEAEGKTNLPADKTFFANMFTSEGRGTRGMSDFIVSSSYGAIDFSNAKVVDWHPISSRFADVGNNKRPNNGAMTCLHESEKLINFPSFDAIMVVMNKHTDSGDISWVGPQTYTLNGVTRTWGLSLTSPGNFDLAFNTEEMAHAWLGQDHSHSADGSVDYGDTTDAMDYGNSAYTSNASYRLWGPNFNAGMRLYRGWTPPRRVATYAGGTLKTKLAAIDHPEADAPLVVKVPISGGSYYTVEFRRSTDPDGIDAGFLRYSEIDPVVVHKVDPSGQIYVEPGSGPIGGMDTGATFTDKTNNVVIKVVSKDATHNLAEVSVSPDH